MTNNYKHDVFLSHNWGYDTEDRDNHERVSRINDALKAEGLKTWFDSERMKGDIVAQMTNGIDKSRIVIAFITEKYIEKASGKGKNGLDDNCKLEFDYACNRKGIDHILVVVMEDACQNARTWTGAIGAKLCNQFYINYRHDNQLEDCINQLKVHIQSISFEDQTKCMLEVNKAPDSPTSVIDNSMNINNNEEQHSSYYGRIEQEDGSIYEGMVKDGTPHGKGRMTYPNGDIYKGKFRDGKRNGDGAYLYRSNGQYYIGQWKDDIKRGTGIFSFKNGTKYIGKFKCDIPHGKGKLISMDGSVQTGMWKKGKLVKGTERNLVGVLNVDGEIYVGEIKDGQKNGKGKVTYENGDIYEGDFLNDVRHGEGKLTLTNGHVYEGKWTEDVKEKGGGKFREENSSPAYKGQSNDGNKRDDFEKLTSQGIEGRSDKDPFTKRIQIQKTIKI